MEYKRREFALKDQTVCILRNAEAEDANNLKHLRKKLGEETYFLIRYPEEIVIPLEEEQFILSKYRDEKDKLMLLALLGDEIAGICAIHPIGDTFKMKHRAGLWIAVQKKYWDCGIGKLLMNQILEFAQYLRYEQVELGVLADNFRARKMYEKSGFQICGQIPRAFKLKDGTYRDEIIMVKEILIR